MLCAPHTVQASTHLWPADDATLRADFRAGSDRERQGSPIRRPLTHRRKGARTSTRIRACQPCNHCFQTFESPRAVGRAARLSRTCSTPIWAWNPMGVVVRGVPTRIGGSRTLSAKSLACEQTSDGGYSASLRKRILAGRSGAAGLRS